VISRPGRALLLCVALVILGSAVGCDWFSESTFELASDSRLPKWIVIPPGLTRSGVSVTMSDYVWPWGSSATFTLRNAKGETLAKIDGKVRGLSPATLKNPPPGFPPGYPSYEVTTVKDMTEVIEHKKMEPIFYVTDDPAVLKELGVQ
jgi:hypothetical protein